MLLVRRSDYLEITDDPPCICQGQESEFVNTLSHGCFSGKLRGPFLLKCLKVCVVRPPCDDENGALLISRYIHTWWWPLHPVKATVLIHILCMHWSLYKKSTSPPVWSTILYGSLSLNFSCPNTWLFSWCSRTGSVSERLVLSEVIYTWSNTIHDILEQHCNYIDVV